MPPRWKKPQPPSLLRRGTHEQFGYEGVHALTALTPAYPNCFSVRTGNRKVRFPLEGINVSRNNTFNPVAMGRKLREISERETSDELAAMPSPKKAAAKKHISRGIRKVDLDETSTELKPYVGHVDDVKDPPYRSSESSDLRSVVAEF